MPSIDDVLGSTDKTSVSPVVRGFVTSRSANGASVQLPDGRRALLPAGESPLGKLPDEGAVEWFLLLEDSDTPILSLTHPAFIASLAAGVVPELRTGQVRVMNIARLPGVRAKVAVAATVPGLDPIASMVGRAANRVKFLSQHLDGERVDIIPWSADRDQLLKNAFAPATVTSTHSDGNLCVVVVPSHLMSAAVGRGGLNASLAGRLANQRVIVVREGANVNKAMEELRSNMEAAA